jgi:putative ABC transport system ATP-binding protein
MILARNLTQRYSHTGPETSAATDLTVLDGVDLEIVDGEVVVILGPSGSGKTTLLGLLAGLDRPSEGEVELAGVPLSTLDEDGRAALRADRIGFIFQSFHLIPTLSALENVLVPLELLESERAPKAAEAEATARRLLDQVGLSGRVEHYPAQLSGGEQQRVGIARAFANEPAVLFADEPTGNLDRATGEEITNLLFELNEQHGTTLVIVTHDLELSRRAHRIIHLAGGHIDRIEVLNRGERHNRLARAGSSDPSDPSDLLDTGTESQEVAG